MGGGSRGSYIIPDMDNPTLSSKIQEVRYTSQGCDYRWEDVRPIPQNNEPFENIWREYRDDAIIR
jgi:hypothetical protein